MEWVVNNLDPRDFTYSETEIEITYFEIEQKREIMRAIIENTTKLRSEIEAFIKKGYEEARLKSRIDMILAIPGISHNHSEKYLHWTQEPPYGNKSKGILEDEVLQALPDDEFWKFYNQLKETASKYFTFRTMKEKYTKDSENPEFLYSGIDTSILVKIVNGSLDPIILARFEMTGRMLDKNGNWCGFPESGKIHGMETFIIKLGEKNP